MNKNCLLLNKIILTEIETFFHRVLGAGIQKVKIVSCFELDIYVESKLLYPLLFFINKHSLCQYKTLIDIICCDRLNKSHRFEITYSLLSVYYNSRLKIICKINENDLLLSVGSLYRSAN